MTQLCICESGILLISQLFCSKSLHECHFINVKCIKFIWVPAIAVNQQPYKLQSSAIFISQVNQLVILSNLLQNWRVFTCGWCATIITLCCGTWPFIIVVHTCLWLLYIHNIYGTPVHCFDQNLLPCIHYIAVVVLVLIKVIWCMHIRTCICVWVCICGCADLHTI